MPSERLTKMEREALFEAIKVGDLKTNWKDCGVSICKLCSAMKKLKKKEESEKQK